MNFENRTLFHADNLDVMREMDSDTIDLIVTDPPFNKCKAFEDLNGRYEDTWSWEEDIHDDWIDSIKDTYPTLWLSIDNANQTHSKGLGAFLCFLAVRLIEMKRILKPEGTIYLQCDQTAGHYIKVIMDDVFGVKNFLNQITWQRTSGGKGNATRKYATSVDQILFYGNGGRYTFNGAYIKLTDEEMDEKFPDTDENGRRYTTKMSDLFSRPSLPDAPDRCYSYKGVTPPHPSGWWFTKETLKRMDENNEILWRKGKLPLRKSFAEDYKGRMLSSLWTDISNTVGNEHINYPTQKPLALVSRMIEASSNKGDVVLDPFCGSASTCIAAENLGRKWVGIDKFEKNHKIVLQRFWEVCELGSELIADICKYKFFEPKGELHYRTTAPERTDDGVNEVDGFKVPRKSAKSSMSRDEMKSLLIKHIGNQCQGCMREYRDERILQIDHIDPVSQGGSNEITNRTLLCGPCNGVKSNKMTLSGLIGWNAKNGHLEDGWTKKQAIDKMVENRDTIRNEMELSWYSGEVK